MNEEEDYETMFPTYDEFLEKLYSLGPIGNAQVIYAILRDHIGKQLATKEILTFELLCKRYNDYLQYIKPFNDIKDKQYIKKDKIRQELGAYIQLSMYNNDYSSQVSDPNDAYLFGL